MRNGKLVGIYFRKQATFVTAKLSHLIRLANLILLPNYYNIEPFEKYTRDSSVLHCFVLLHNITILSIKTLDIFVYKKNNIIIIFVHILDFE